MHLVDLLKKMFIKDPDQRIALIDMTMHDWITCNGVQPLPIKNHKPVVLEKDDYVHAIGKVATIELIKIRMRKNVERIRLKKSTNNLNPDEKHSKHAPKMAGLASLFNVKGAAVGGGASHPQATAQNKLMSRVTQNVLPLHFKQHIEKE